MTCTFPRKEVRIKLGTVQGPQQAADVEALVGRWHRQVQERVFGTGYRILLMPIMAMTTVR